MSNLRDLILNAPDRKLEPVEVPEWGATVYLKVLSAEQVSRYRSIAVGAVNAQTREVTDPVALMNVGCQVVAWGCCDENGARLFADADVVALGEKSSVVIDRLSAQILRISGLGRSVATAKKNSESSQNNGSGIG